VEFVAGSDLAAAQDQLARGELSAAVVFTQPFGIQIHEGTDNIQNRAVQAIFENIALLHGTASVILSAESAANVVEGSPHFVGAAIGRPVELSATRAANGRPYSEQMSYASAQDNTVAITTPRVEEKIFGVSRSMIDYYAITMIVMMFFMGSAGSGASIIYSGNKDGTLRRTMASPLSRVSVYLQYVISSVPYNLMQIGIVMVVSTTVLGAHYATTWQANVLLFGMLFCAGLAASAVSLIVGLLVKFNPQAIIMLIMWPMLFLGGTFSKEIFIPGFSEYLPSSIIQAAAFDLTLFGQTGRSVTVLVVCVVIIVAATAIGAALFNKKELAA
jgi:ABC-2 type transport system permease protein